jgi:hypothetical protein
VEVVFRAGITPEHVVIRRDLRSRNGRILRKTAVILKKLRGSRRTGRNSSPQREEDGIRAAFG